ncbi:MAG: methylenetetrahydrofolate reductase [Alphaproteobacteria bacterium]|nr:methylenetetrahydrofolate reductase [Alphaproteobacteria bacterium]
MEKPTFSFEFFPAKSPQGEAQLWAAMEELAALGPAFMTVTYGAGGSTRQGTLETLRQAVQRFPDISFASHLTFVSTPRAELDAYLKQLWDAGVQKIVALRGDLPQGARYEDFHGAEYFQWTSDFVSHLKAHYPFSVIVSAYPEKHPDAPSLAADIEALRKKCEAGADFALTQFFFENANYYDFLKACRSEGIVHPLYPGLLPVHDYQAMLRFAARCHAKVPEWLHQIFEQREDRPYDIAVEILEGQVQNLLQHNVQHFHFYTLNKAKITGDIIKKFF